MPHRDRRPAANFLRLDEVQRQSAEEILKAHSVYEIFRDYPRVEYTAELHQYWHSFPGFSCVGPPKCPLRHEGWRAEDS